MANIEDRKPVSSLVGKRIVGVRQGDHNCFRIILHDGSEILADADKTFDEDGMLFINDTED